MVADSGPGTDVSATSLRAELVAKRDIDTIIVSTTSGKKREARLYIFTLLHYTYHAAASGRYSCILAVVHVEYVVPTTYYK